MADLRRLQDDFAAALRDASTTPSVTRWLAGDEALAQRRMAIYRGNVAASAEKALAAAYPVARQVVGDDFFRGLARAYQRATPSTCGDLTDYGAALPDFVAAFEPTRALPYLPDLARLEWAVHRAHGAADPMAWDASALAAVAPDDQPHLVLAWQPGTAAIASTFPIVRLWTIHQPAFDGEFAVDWTQAEHALVARDGFAVTVTALDDGGLAFLHSSLAGARLGDAVAAALAADPAFDLGRLLARAIVGGQVRGLTLSSDPT